MDQPTLAEQKMAELKQRLIAGNFANASERQNTLKELVGWKIAARAKDGDVIGLGSGSTSKAAIVALRERARVEGLKIQGVATSTALAELAREEGLIPVSVMPAELLTGTEPPAITWGFDGADEVETSTGRLVKGGGAAHVIERMVADRTPEWIVIVDESKLVEHLGEFPVPVEVTNNPIRAGEIAEHLMSKYGARTADIRTRDGQVVLTDSGNFIIDAEMGAGNVPMGLENEWTQIEGVVPNGVGVFTGYGQEIWVARANGDIDVMPGAAAA